MNKYNHESIRLEAIELAKQWVDKGAVIIDTETTGLEWGCEVVEVAMIELTTGNVLLNTLVKPTQPIPDEAIDIHGITNEMVVYEPAFSRVVFEIIEAIEDREVIAWNASFDLKLLLSTLSKITRFDHRERQFLTELLRSDINDHNRWHCGMLNYAQFKGDWNDAYGDFKWHSLENAAKQLDIAIPETRHRALEDCLLTREVILKMIEVV